MLKPALEKNEKLNISFIESVKRVDDDTLGLSGGYERFEDGKQERGIMQGELYTTGPKAWKIMLDKFDKQDIEKFSPAMITMSYCRNDFDCSNFIYVDIVARRIREGRKWRIRLDKTNNYPYTNPNGWTVDTVIWDDDETIVERLLKAARENLEKGEIL